MVGYKRWGFILFLSTLFNAGGDAGTVELTTEFFRGT